jgi:hypothetical protein
MTLDLVFWILLVVLIIVAGIGFMRRHIGS